MLRVSALQRLLVRQPPTRVRRRAAHAHRQSHSHAHRTDPYSHRGATPGAHPRTRCADPRRIREQRRACDRRGVLSGQRRQGWRFGIRLAAAAGGCSASGCVGTIGGQRPASSLSLHPPLASSRAPDHPLAGFDRVPVLVADRNVTDRLRDETQMLSDGVVVTCTLTILTNAPRGGHPLRVDRARAGDERGTSLWPFRGRRRCGWGAVRGAAAQRRRHHEADVVRHIQNNRTRTACLACSAARGSRCSGSWGLGPVRTRGKVGLPVPRPRLCHRAHGLVCGLPGQNQRCHWSAWRQCDDFRCSAPDIALLRLRAASVLGGVVFSPLRGSRGLGFPVAAQLYPARPAVSRAARFFASRPGPRVWMASSPSPLGWVSVHSGQGSGYPGPGMAQGAESPWSP